MSHVRNARHLYLNRCCDLLFDLFCGASRPLCDNSDVVVGDVRVRLYRQIVKGHNAPTEEDDCRTEYKPTITESKVNQAAKHYWSTVFCSVRAFETTCCPTLMPEST